MTSSNLSDKLREAFKADCGASTDSIWSDEQLVQCIERAKSTHNKRGRRSVCTYVLVICLLVPVVLMYLPLPENMLMFFAKLVSQYEVFYHAARAFRSVGAVLQSNFPDTMTEWHNQPCFVMNPFFKTEEPQVECNSCTNITIVTRYTVLSEAEFMDKHLATGNPFILEGDGQGKSIDDIKANYLSPENVSLLNAGEHYLTSNFSTITSFMDIFDKIPYMTYPETNMLFVHWSIRRPGALRWLRQLFPIPQFMNGPANLAENDGLGYNGLHHMLLVQDAYTDMAPMPDPPVSRDGSYSKTLVLYMQNQGERTLVFTPHEDCQMDCVEMSVDVFPGDMVFWGPSTWQVTSEAIPASKTSSHISFAYLAISKF